VAYIDECSDLSLARQAGSAAALPAVKGYDDATGVGSPDYYIQSFFP
jgi:hypothetical protein